LEVGEVVLEGQMDDGVGLLGAGPDRVQVVEISSVRADAPGLKEGCGGVRTGQAGDLVAVA
jgi:hypothetical protein